MPYRLWDKDPNQIDSIEKLITHLNDTMGREGYIIKPSEEIRAGGFKRVYFNKGLMPDQANLYLDLRIGPEAPTSSGKTGRVIEMASSKPETYGIPGFSRHIMGQSSVTGPLETFTDYIRSVYAAATEERKAPQQMAWSVYQEGYGGFQYPGSGAVLGPSSSSGKRAFTAATVRYWTPPGTYIQDYISDVSQGLASSVGGVQGLQGYVPELEKWKAWVPGATRLDTRTGETLFGAPRPPADMTKSFTTAFEARELSTSPIVIGGQGKMEKIKPTMPGTSKGIRQGWTRSSVVLPGELDPRDVLSQRLVLGDHPDMPGAGYISPSSLNIPVGKETMQLYAIGEEGFVQYRFGVQSIDQLKSLIKEKQLSISNLEGKFEHSGTDKFEVGSWMGADPNDPEKQIRKPIAIDRKGYDIRLGKATLHIPKYYDPTVPGGRFSNMPIYQNGQMWTTDDIVAQARQALGDQVNIQQLSAIGSQGEEHAAEVYLNAPIDRLTGLAYKTGGLKMYPVEAAKDMMMRFVGVGQKQKIDIFTQEGKIPSRALMTSFGIMNMKTQIEFLEQFLPQDTPEQKTGLRDLQSYVRRAYTDGDPKIDIDQMGMIYGSAVNDFVTGESLFADMMGNIRNMKKGDAKDIFKKFGIGLSQGNQQFGAMIYSQGQMEEMKRLVSELPPDMQKMITFERLKTHHDKVDNLVKATTGHDLARNTYMLKFNIPEGNAMAMQAGISIVPEYQFQQGFINTKGIMSLMENFPEAAREMGIMGDQSEGNAWLGPTDIRNKKVRPSVRGWDDMYFWMGYQKDMNEGFVSVPRETAMLNSSISAELELAIKKAKSEPTTREQLKALKTQLQKISPELMGHEKGVRYDDSFFWEPKSMTLVPKLSSVMGIESYDEGIREGETVTYMADNYMRLLESAVQASISSDPSYRIDEINSQKTRFYKRVHKAWFPENDITGRTKRSKEVFRNLTGVQLPGARGGRYQGLTQLELGEAFADDDYVRKMLSYSGFKSKKHIDSIMTYLKSDPDAYLPILTQRYPDVSSKHMFMPMKLRLRKQLEDRGVSVPTGATSHDVLYMSSFANRFFVGDFDADPAMSKVLPIYDIDPESMEHTGIYKMNPALQKEFDQGFKLYEDAGNSIDTALQAMFGEKWRELDVGRKNASDYMSTLKSGGASFIKRLTAIGKPSKYLDLLSAATDVANFKIGMGVSYNRRTLTEDIADAVLQMGNEGVRSKAYEAGGLPYQMYLDRQKEMKGGFTELETMLNSFGIYVSGGRPGNVNYGVSFKVTEQGKSEQIQAKGAGWLTAGGSGMETGSMDFMLRVMMGHISDMPDWKESNAMLAWGFGTPGNAQEVFENLENPFEFLKKYDFTERDSTRANAMSKMLELGKVGFNSPYYMSAAFRAVKRFSNKEPGLLNDPSIKLPWMDQGMLPIGEIAKTKEYQYFDILDRLFLGGSEVVSAREMNTIADLGQERLNRVMGGIARSWFESTGGMSTEGAVLNEGAQRLASMRDRYAMTVQQNPPIINASEFGALAPITERAKRAGWHGLAPEYRMSTIYQSILRSLGGKDIMSDAFGKGGYFLAKQYESTRPAIEGGVTFESEFARRHKDLTHVGQVEKENVLDYEVEGLRIRGIPDFLGYDDTTGNLIIADTKSPFPTRGEGQWSSEWARKKAMSYQNRMQQVAYAYGLEKKANELGDDEWISLMRGLNIASDDQALKMKEAARKGKFDVSLRTGRVGPGGIYEEFAPVPISYSPADRLEFEAQARGIKSAYMNPNYMATVAQRTYSHLLDPRNVPIDIMSTHTRANRVPDMSMYRFLETYTNSVQRMAGGGELEEGKRFRVGEGGPEEIVVKSGGDVEVVPTHELTESRQARGEDVSREGYLGGRFNGGGTIESGPTDDDEEFKPQKNEGEFLGLQGADTPDVQTPNISSQSQQSQQATPASQSQSQSAQSSFDPEQMINMIIKGVTTGVQAGVAQAVEKIEVPTPKISFNRSVDFDKMQIKLLEDLGDFQKAGGVSMVKEFDQQVSKILRTAFKESGLESELSAYPEGGAHSWDLLQKARDLGIKEELYEPELRKQGLLDKARTIKKGVQGYYDAKTLLETYPELEHGAAWTGQARRIMGDIKEAEGDPDDAFALMQARVTAHDIDAGKTQGASAKVRYAGADVETIENYFRAVKKNTESHEKLSKAQEMQVGVEEAYADARKTALEQTIAKNKMEISSRMAYQPTLYPGGEFVGWAKAREMRDTGEIGIGDFDEMVKTEEMRKSSDTAQRSLSRINARGRTGAIADRLGAMSRRLLGGFGLMYLGSIANFIASPGQMGYAESLEQQVMSEQILSGQMGSYSPFITPEMRLTKARQMYGGMGQRGLASLQASALENAPGLVTAQGAAQSFLGGFGLTQFAAGLLGIGGLAALPVSATAGLVATAGMAGIQTYGALQNPELTGVQLAGMGGWSRSFGEDQTLGQQISGYLRNVGPTQWASTWEKMTSTPEELGRIQETEQRIYRMQEFSENRRPGQTFMGMLEQEGLEKPEAMRSLSYYAQFVANKLGTDDKATYAALGIGERYGLALTEGRGGTLEQLASQLESGFNPEDLARAIAATPGADANQRQQSVTEIITSWLDQGGLDVGDIAERELGSRRFEGLGLMAPDYTGKQLDMFQSVLGRMSAGNAQAYTERAQLEERRRLRGLEYEDIGAMQGTYRNMTPEERDLDIRTTRLQSLAENTMDSLESVLQTLSESLVDMSEYSDMSNIQRVALAQVAQGGMTLATQMQIGGADDTFSRAAGLVFGGATGMSMQDARMYQGMLGGDRRRWAQMAQQNPQLAFTLGGMTAQGVGGNIPLEAMFMTDVTPQGAVTGLPWGTSSLGTPIASSEDMVGRLFGTEASWAEQGFDTDLIRALQAGGTRNGRLYQMSLQQQQQGAYAGIQARQLALQREYTPQFWQYQDQLRDLGYAQTEFGFQQQQAQLDESQQYFWRTTGLQQQQMQYQRQWAVEDWGFQDRTRAMQWGWKQEDFAESVRFMTGRDRRLAERGMGRETIMHDLEGEQIDKQRERQKTLWAIEDDRLEANIEHQTRLFDLQQENLDKQIEFFEERKRLEKEYTELQREYWEKTMQIQEEAAGINAYYNETMMAVQKTMMVVNEYSEDMNAIMKLIGDETMPDLVAVLKELNPELALMFEEAMAMLEKTPGASDTPPSLPPGPPIDYTPIEEEDESWNPHLQRQHGGRVYPGQSYLVGEVAPEMFRPDVTGTILPSDPWGAAVISPESSSNEPIHLVVRVGDETLIDRILDRVDQEIVL